MFDEPLSSALGFCLNPLDRSSVEADPEALSRARLDARTRTLVFAGDEPILSLESPGEAAATALIPLRSTLGQAAASVAMEQLFLGQLAGAPVIATLVDAAAGAALGEAPGHRRLNLRAVAVEGLVEPGELGMLAQAKALFHWHGTHPFCAKCGAATLPSPSRMRRDCPVCEAQHFPRTDPVVIMLVSRGDSCLLGRSPRFPAAMYSCLAGFLSPGETIEDSVRREVFEEAGIQVGRVRYMASQPWPFPASLMIGCEGEAESGTITIDRTELEDARWFSRHEVRAMLSATHPEGFLAPVPIAIAHHLLQLWLARPV